MNIEDRIDSIIYAIADNDVSDMESARTAIRRILTAVDQEAYDRGAMEATTVANGPWCYGSYDCVE
jgi:hypothetical protein